MAFFHVVQVDGIDYRSGRRRANLPDCATEGVAGAEGGDSEALTFPCVIGERQREGGERREKYPEGESAGNISRC